MTFLRCPPNRDPFRAKCYSISIGFFNLPESSPLDFLTVLDDINAPCVLRDSCCMCGNCPINNIRTDNCQACIESRLTNLRKDAISSGILHPCFEACIYAAYVCMYKLFTATWEATFIPTFCSCQVLRFVQNTRADRQWDNCSDFFIWLVFVEGAFAHESSVQKQVFTITCGFDDHQRQRLRCSWDSIKRTLTLVIWSESALAPQIRVFWEGMQ